MTARIRTIAKWSAWVILWLAVILTSGALGLLAVALSHTLP